MAGRRIGAGHVPQLTVRLKDGTEKRANFRFR